MMIDGQIEHEEYEIHLSIQMRCVYSLSDH